MVIHYFHSSKLSSGNLQFQVHFSLFQSLLLRIRFSVVSEVGQVGFGPLFPNFVDFFNFCQFLGHFCVNFIEFLIMFWSILVDFVQFNLLFQGFFIFLFHVFLNEKAQAEFSRHVRSKSDDIKVINTYNCCTFYAVNSGQPLKRRFSTHFQSFFSKGSSDYASQDMRDTTTDMSTKADRKISNLTSSTDLQTKTTTDESKWYKKLYPSSPSIHRNVTYLEKHLHNSKH